jgi:NTP pyrophosphatase (non-canonical NTP hydrolase)
MDEVWQEIVVFNDQHFPEWRNWDWRLTSNALAGEVGEVCDATKHAYGGGTNSTSGKITRRDIAKEVFDVQVYSVLLIGGMGYSRQEYIDICKEKLLVLYQRMETRKTKSVLRQKFNNEA